MKRTVLLLVTIALLLSLVSWPVYSQSGDAAIARNVSFVPDQVIVGFDQDVDGKAVPAQAAALAGEVQAAVVKVEGNAALLQLAPETDVEGLAAQLMAFDNVAYAEPNFIFWIPELAAGSEEPNQEFIVRRMQTNEDGAYQDHLIPIQTLQNMKRRSGSAIQAVYPNDLSLWWNNGWSAVQAEIVFPNTTSSRNVCVIDTGVDYLHPDLLERVIRGRDFVNDDADPMDDNGHGTHVAGIIAARQGNKIGIAGVSTGRVVAVKALTAQGWGTNFEIAQAIYSCANRSDVSVINLSLGGSGRSTMQADAVDYAVNVKQKLMVAAAGNSNTSSKFYPAAFSVDFPDKVLSVAASGKYVEYDIYTYLDNWCKASYSNYGSWVDIIGPGTDIYSTLPFRKPFSLYEYQEYDGYGYLSGTSMAAPFVSAVAARAWGFKPGYLNHQISQYIKYWSDPVDTACWPVENHATRRVNVAAVLQRGGLSAAAFNANTGLPLTGATITAFQSGVARGSGQTTPVTYPYSSGTWTTQPAYTDLVNLPGSLLGWDYQLRVHRSGHTATPQAAFVNYWTDTGHFTVFPGSWVWGGEAIVPVRSTNFTATYASLDGETSSDLLTFLPKWPKPVDDGQPAPFIVSMFNGWDAPNYFGGSSVGNLSVFPFARQMVESGTLDYPFFDSTIVRSKPGFPARPYYTGEYVFAVYNPSASYPASFFIWKDGVIKKRVNQACTSTFWRPLTLSQSGGVATYTEDNYCGSSAILPYTP
ncbi:MAG: S8 family serine peptidase [Anaerolineaceae bacterium]|jgi:subtilisin family serine protease